VQHGARDRLTQYLRRVQADAKLEDVRGAFVVSLWWMLIACGARSALDDTVDDDGVKVHVEVEAPTEALHARHRAARNGPCVEASLAGTLSVMREDGVGEEANATLRI
jgi:hypothetical protein